MSSTRKTKREIEKELKKINKKNIVELHNKKIEIKKVLDTEEFKKYYKDIFKNFI